MHGYCVVVPAALRMQILDKLHEGHRLGHQSAETEFDSQHGDQDCHSRLTK